MIKTGLAVVWMCVVLSARGGLVERTVEYTDGENLFAGVVVYDESIAGPRPGVMIVHQWTGPGRYELYRARMLAEQGYVAFVADIRAVISVHGGLDSPSPEDGTNIRSSVLLLHASHDPTTPPDQISALIEELDTHNVDWQLNYYAQHGHSFTDPESSGYNAVADRRFWAALLHFLAEHLNGDA